MYYISKMGTNCNPELQGDKSFVKINIQSREATTDCKNPKILPYFIINFTRNIEKFTMQSGKFLGLYSLR